MFHMGDCPLHSASSLGHTGNKLHILHFILIRHTEQVSITHVYGATSLYFTGHTSIYIYLNCLNFCLSISLINMQYLKIHD